MISWKCNFHDLPHVGIAYVQLLYKQCGKLYTGTQWQTEGWSTMQHWAVWISLLYGQIWVISSRRFMHVPVMCINAEFWGGQVLSKACSELYAWRVDGKASRVVRSCLNLIPPQPSALDPAPEVPPRHYVCISAGWRTDHQELNHFEKGGSNLLYNNLKSRLPSHRDR